MNGDSRETNATAPAVSVTAAAAAATAPAVAPIASTQISDIGIEE